MPMCSPNVIDIGPGLISVSLQLISLLALVYGLNRNHIAIQNGKTSEAMKNGNAPPAA